MVQQRGTGDVLMVAWMGLVKGAMLLWQGAIWLVNTALLANPVMVMQLAGTLLEEYGPDVEIIVKKPSTTPKD